MKVRTKKKAFTIVELVVVIAVIAVLAAVLIPTFSNVIKKAQKSSDTQLVRNLNTALTVDGKAPTTMQAALDAAADAGYDVSKINAAETDNEILWDSANNVFCYLEKGETKPTYIPETTLTKTAKSVDYWRITAKDEYLNGPYSVYYTGTTTAITTTVGFDVGTTTGVTSITYKRNDTDPAQDVVIRTNGGTLTVDAPKDTITHYNGIDKIVIKSVAGHSFYEHGNVAVSMEVQDGHVVVEPTATVKELNVPATATATAKVEVKENSTVNTLVVDSTAASVEVKENAKVKNVVASDSNTNVTIPESVGAAKVQKTEVGTAGDLKDSLTNGDKYIVLTSDIDIQDRITISQDVIIDGSTSKFSISAANENINNGRVINIWGSDIDVTLKNLKVVGPTKGAYTRGINIGEGNPSVTIENCEITANYYAINIIDTARKAKINIFSSKSTGWCALQSWGALNEISIVNSDMIGINDKTYNADGWNNFGTIVVEGDTTFATEEGAEQVLIRISGGTITAKQTTGNKQYCISFNANSRGNTVILSGVELDCPDGTYISVGGEFWETNTLIIDDEVII